MTWAVLVATAVLVVTNLLNNRWLPGAYLVTCPVVAVGLFALGRIAGLSWTELGVGRSALLRGVAWAGLGIAVVAVFYAVAFRLPAARAASGPVPSTAEALRSALLEVPFGTVLLEETAFRSVIFGLLRHDHGAVVATAVSSVLFGLWHVAPSLRDDGVVRPQRLAGRRGTVLWVAGTVVFTALAGVLFCLLRLVSGSVFAAMGLHWATNGLGSLFRLAGRRAPGR
jgi:uncharacterized protein